MATLDDWLNGVTSVLDTVKQGVQTYDLVMDEDPKAVGAGTNNVQVTEPPKTTGVDATASTTASSLLGSPVVLVLLGVVVLLALRK